MRKAALKKSNLESSRRIFIKHSAVIGAGMAFSPLFSIGNTSSKNQYDYVIIGAGSSGCVLANRLTEDPLVKVLLIEAGGPDTKAEIHEPGKWPSLLGSDIDWNYSTQEEAFLNNRKITWPRGKVLGGSSAINAMIYVRGHRLNYDSWPSSLNASWSYKEVLPYFKKLENNPTNDAIYHGMQGPLLISHKSCADGNCSAFIEAAMEMGYKGPAWNFNGEQQENGAGLYQLNIKNGKRQSAATAFLKPVLSRPNLKITTSAHVRRLLFSGNRVTGVEYLQAGTVQKAYSLREIIVSAGAIETPKILMLSGIGPADHLRSFGIKVIANLPGVGKNLQDHLACSLPYESTSPFSTLEPPECAGLFVRTKYASFNSAPDVQYILFHIPTGNEKSSYIMLPVLATPKSRGSITLASLNPLQSPIIKPNYLQQEADLRVILEGIKLGEEIANTKAFTKHRGTQGKLFETEKEMEEHIRSTATTLYHPVGTCKMGEDEMAVVQSDLKVHGVIDLRVADASIMPTLINANTNATCMMIGEYAADLMKARRF